MILAEHPVVVILHRGVPGTVVRLTIRIGEVIDPQAHLATTLKRKLLLVLF